MNSKNIDFLLKINKEQSELFSNPLSIKIRELYHQKHPTEILSFGCMDGRLNPSVIADIPLGIIKQFRELGGRFDLGNPYLRILIQDLAENALSQGRSVIIFVTYHFSQSNPHLGCAGFGYDKKLAIEETSKLKMVFDQIFRGGVQTVYPILVGIETDKESLIFHDSLNNQRTFDISEHLFASLEEFASLIKGFYPDLNQQGCLDLLPFFTGNQKYLKEELRLSVLPVHTHKEFVLGVGRGFSWINQIDIAFLIGPYRYNFQEAITRASLLLQENLVEGRIPKEDGVLIMASGVYGRYKSVEVDRHFAEEGARSMARFTQSVIQNSVPELWPSVNLLVGVVNKNTLGFTPISLE